MLDMFFERIVALVETDRFLFSELGATTCGSQYVKSDDVALIRTSAMGPYSLPLGSLLTLSPARYLCRLVNPTGIWNCVIFLGRYPQTLSWDSQLNFQIPSTHGNRGSPIVDLDGRAVAIEYDEKCGRCLVRRRGTQFRCQVLWQFVQVMDC